MRVELTDNADRVLRARYLRRGEGGEFLEDPAGLFARVARGTAQAEAKFGPPETVGEWTERFNAAMAALEFLPNTPTLMNAGTPGGQLSACFVLPVGDSMPEIFDALKLMALIQQSGGGTGFSFSRLRPAGDFVSTTGGLASGPVSFMRIFDAATEHIRQGGKRRGANMGVLRSDHPDIAAFIDAKRDGRSFSNFNLSVGATDAFMQAAEAGAGVELVNPRTGDVASVAPADELFAKIAQAAWATGDPGLVFLDAINRAQPTPALGPIEATNPCGEVPLLPYEACNLGSINLARVVRRRADGAEIDWEKLAGLVALGVRFLDDVVEVNAWPAEPIAAAARGNRKIGLGVMGFAEMLIKLGVPYGSPASVAIADELAKFLSGRARAASEELAVARGVFPNWERSVYAARGLRVRNATQVSIAPTGTIGIIAGTTAGIEPLFALAYRRENVLDGQTLPELNPLFLEYARRRGFHTEAMVRALAAGDRLADVPGIPEDARALFRTALEISPQEHLAVQAAFQKHTDNAVSKTVNLPHEATAADIAAIYRAAWRAGCKGITVFRYGSKGEQVLSLGTGGAPIEREHFARCDPEDCRV